MCPNAMVERCAATGEIVRLEVPKWHTMMKYLLVVDIINIMGPNS
jgi:hypothetical protein